MAASNPTREDLYTALRNADAAGDNAGAAKLATYIQSLPKSLQLQSKNPAEYDKNSPEHEAKYGPQAVSGYENFVAGAGKAVTDLGRGIKQIGTETLDLLTGGNRGKGLRAAQDEINTRDQPLMDTGSGLAGNIAGNVATTVIPASAVGRGAQAANLTRTALAARALANPATYRAAASAGALQGALQPVGTQDSRTQNAALGAAGGLLGTAGANAVGRIAQPLVNRLTPEKAAAVQTLEHAGVPLDAAQRSGSRSAEVVKRAIDDNPLTGPGQKVFAEGQRRAFTQAALHTIGENADAATSDVMDRAASRIGGVFDAVAARNPVRYDAQLHNDLAQISRDAHRELPSNEYHVIANQVAEIFDKATLGGGLIDGAAYQNLRTSLGRISQPRSPLGHWAGELRGTIDDALQRSANPADMADLRVARTQYRRMMQMESAIDTEGSGQISPAKLANSLGTKSNRRASVYGRGDTELVQLAQAGKSILPDKFPNSGTPARLLGQAAVGALAGGGFGYTRGDTRDGALAGLVAGTAGLAGARTLMNNNHAATYLANGLQNQIARRALTAPTRIAPNAAVSTALAMQRRQAGSQ